MDNIAIERIARPDLAAQAQALLDRHGEDDDVVFFLARLVWQGEMADCIPTLLAIASDPGRGLYARLTSIRAVMAVGSEAEKEALWAAFAGEAGPLSRRLVGELLDGAAPTVQAIDRLLSMIERLEPADRFESTGLGMAFHEFINRLPLMADGAPDQPLAHLAKGLNLYLDREPYLERGECHISETFAWLVPQALHAVDRLVAARAAQALDPYALAIMLKAPAHRFWRSDEASDYRTSLANNVPRWQPLNDALYWANIADGRARLARKGERLVDDWQVAYLGHYWGFGRNDFERCLGWLLSNEALDDRLVALSRCVTLYRQENKPRGWQKRLREACAGEAELEVSLKARLNPRPSSAVRRMEARQKVRNREREARETKQQQDRADWIDQLVADPDRVRHPPGVTPGEMTWDQFDLMQSIPGNEDQRGRERHADWQGLIPEFGEPVARAYRDAAMAHWRAYRPPLRSEGAAAGTTPWTLIFAMAGLAIEADEKPGFIEALSATDAAQAMRYFAWQLNGFPHWLEPLFRAHQAVAFPIVTRELRWELEASKADTPTHYLLHDIVFHAPWLHAEVAPILFDWLLAHDMPNADNLRYCLTIMSGGGIDAGNLAALAREKLAAGTPDDPHRSRWYALWTDCDADAAIPAVEAELDRMGAKDASSFAQRFVVGLLGDRHGAGTAFESYQTAPHLKSLYLLMHRHIRAADDIERAGKGVYSPTLRDNAQDARNNLFNLLVKVPGPDAYAAIKALETEHPDPDYRRWMAVRARERAIADADEPAWTVRQVHAFASAV